MYLTVSSNLLSVAFLFVAPALATYGLVDDYGGNNFFNKMNFFTGADPTNGYVTYVSQSSAQSGGLISVNNNIVYMGVDHNNVASGSGRQSVRVSSKNSYTHMLVVADIGHMPGGVCGVWPAFWSLGPNWPNNGEIDIIEGVNDQTTNFMSLHTSPGCSITSQSNGQLPVYSSNCDTSVNGNEGCSIHDSNTQSYGSGFNGDGGGQYAMEWTSSGISIWWFNRGNPAPSDMFSANPNPANWGKPKAQFAGSGCNWDGHFASHNLVFDTTFCGDWAGAVFGSDTTCTNQGGSNCNAFVQNNPGAFAPAYWNIGQLKVYQQNGQHVSRRDNVTVTPEEDFASLHEAVAMAKQARSKRAPAYAAQVAPSDVPKASQTVDPVSASVDAIRHPGHARPTWAARLRS